MSESALGTKSSASRAPKPPPSHETSAPVPKGPRLQPANTAPIISTLLRRHFSSLPSPTLRENLKLLASFVSETRRAATPSKPKPNPDTAPSDHRILAPFLNIYIILAEIHLVDGNQRHNANELEDRVKDFANELEVYNMMRVERALATLGEERGCGCCTGAVREVRGMWYGIFEALKETLMRDGEGEF